MGVEVSIEGSANGCYYERNNTFMIEIKDIEKLAELSRIKLTAEEKAQMQKEIGSILSYIDQIKGVSSEALAGATDREKQVKQKVRNVMREDAKPHETGINTEVILADAPQREGNYFKVKKIL